MWNFSKYSIDELMRIQDAVDVLMSYGMMSGGLIETNQMIEELANEILNKTNMTIACGVA